MLLYTIRKAFNPMFILHYTIGKASNPTFILHAIFCQKVPWQVGVQRLRRQF
jgi:hypothetical protein